MDEFVVERLAEFDGLKLQSIDGHGVSMDDGDGEKEKADHQKKNGDHGSKDLLTTMTQEEQQKLVGFFKDALGKAVSEVKVRNLIVVN